jgi:monofunctional glycosyltransferase
VKKARWIALFALALLLAMAAASVPWSPANYRPIAALERRDPGATALMRLRRAQAGKKGAELKIVQRWVPLDRVSIHLQRAVVAAEDGGFYRHGGVEWGLLRDALIHDVKERRWARGASTITQQVAKNLYLSPSKRPSRKVKEIILALNLERRLSKRRILEIYLNIAEWGHGLFGAEAAARFYFGKSAADLTPDEAVALTAVLPSPRKHSPLDNSKWVEQRKAWVRRRVRAVWGEPKPPPAAPAEEPPAPPAEPPEFEVLLEPAPPIGPVEEDETGEDPEASEVILESGDWDAP